MHDQPEPTEEEQELAPQRRREHEEQQGLAPADPELPADLPADDA